MLSLQMCKEPQALQEVRLAASHSVLKVIPNHDATTFEQAGPHGCQVVACKEMLHKLLVE